MEEKTRPLKLLKKLHNIMVAVESIPKNGWNEKQKYAYAMEADVLEAFRKELIKENVFITSSLMGENSKPEGWGILTTVNMTYTIYDLESDEILSLEFAGQGMDGGDKGIYKAYTGANKYFLLKTFWLPTYEDPENDGGPPQKASRGASKSSYTPTPAATDNKKDGTIEFRMKSKFGDAAKPAKCGFCNKYHVIAGEEIVKVNGKYGKEECLDPLPF